MSCSRFSFSPEIKKMIIIQMELNGVFAMYAPRNRAADGFSLVEGNTWGRENETNDNS